MKTIKLVANKAIRRSDETDYYIYDSDTGKPVAEWLNGERAQTDVDLRNKEAGRERYYIRSITHRAGTLENPRTPKEGSILYRSLMEKFGIDKEMAQEYIEEAREMLTRGAHKPTATLIRTQAEILVDLDQGFSEL